MKARMVRIIKVTFRTLPIEETFFYKVKLVKIIQSVAIVLYILVKCDGFARLRLKFLSKAFLNKRDS